MDRNKRPTNPRALKLIKIICLSLLVITSCSCGYSTANKPAVTITTAPTGIAAGDVKISVDISKFEIVEEPGSGQNPGKGHLIYYLDVPVPTYYDHSAISRAGTFAIAHDTSYVWKGVTPGQHTFAVQLVNQDDTPLAAPVIDSLTVNVGPPKGNPVVKITVPAADTPLSPGNIFMSVAVDNFIISKEHTGVINRKGEGHLIYYLDEDPPTDAGIPAVTDTSVVSSQTDYVWRNIKEGKHTWAVQLVNNDDSPLQPPVITKLSLDVAPAD